MVIQIKQRNKEKMKENNIYGGRHIQGYRKKKKRDEGRRNKVRKGRFREGKRKGQRE